MSSTEVISLLNENAYIEAQEFMQDMDHKVTSEDVAAANKLGIDLAAGAMHFVQTYAGTVNFIHKMKANLVRFGTLTERQLYVCLDILGDEIKKGRIRLATKDDRGDAVPVTDVKASGPDVDAGERSVLADAENTFLDISVIPDGRYAVIGEDGEFVYYKVFTLRHWSPVRKRFRWGKFYVGAERWPAGTIEVRVQVGDTHELVGYQKPGEGYRGVAVEDLLTIMSRPSTYAKFYARQKTRCGICGKSLTDDNSKVVGIGPDCFKRWGMDYWSQYNRYTAVNEFRKEHGDDAIPPWLYAGTNDPTKVDKKVYGVKLGA